MKYKIMIILGVVIPVLWLMMLYFVVYDFYLRKYKDVES